MGIRLCAEHHSSSAVCFLGRPRGHVGKEELVGTARVGAVTQVIRGPGGVTQQEEVRFCAAQVLRETRMSQRKD